MSNNHVRPLVAATLAQAKFAFTTRRVNKNILKTLVSSNLRPQAGQLLLAEVTAIGQHKRIELADGRRAHLFPGDQVVLAYGARYAPDQFEGVVPADLAPCQMVAAGGIAAREIARHANMQTPTQLSPLGALGDADGRPLNISDFALAPLPPLADAGTRPLILVVCGTAMNAGKTHAAAELIRGLRARGLRTGAAKLTGTGSGGDLWRMQDAGGDPVLDFTDAGLPSTYGAHVGCLVEVLDLLTAHLARAGVDAMVLEIADGLGQDETLALLEAPRLRALIDGIVFAAGDALGAAGGAEWLAEHGLPILAISGQLTRSPLAIQETCSLTPYPVLTAQALADGRHLGALVERLDPGQRRSA